MAAGASETGVYLLLFRLRRQVRGPGALRFSPGVYAYAGSARGAGGLATRLRRHFNLVPSKTARWNIDRLTMSRGYHPLGAIVFTGPDRDECDLVRRLRRAAPVRPAAPGFGNHDDRLKRAPQRPRGRPCPAHAWIFHRAVRPPTLAAALKGEWHPFPRWRRTETKGKPS